jgi:hypothetical protein
VNVAQAEWAVVRELGPELRAMWFARHIKEGWDAMRELAAQYRINDVALGARTFDFDEAVYIGDVDAVVGAMNAYASRLTDLLSSAADRHDPSQHRLLDKARSVRFRDVTAECWPEIYGASSQSP